jgi:hypothetical protein
MYTGTVINDLIAMVEENEQHVSVHDHEELTSWSVLPAQELFDAQANLVGVA